MVMMWHFVALLVDDVHHGGQRGGLAGAGGPGHQHQTARFVEQFLDARRNADLLHRQQLVGNLPQHQAEVALLLEHADAEPRHVAEREAEVRAAAFARALDVLLGRDAAHQFLGVLRLERRAFDAVQNAVHANHRRRADADVQVGRAFGHHQLQQIGHGVRHNKLTKSDATLSLFSKFSLAFTIRRRPSRG